MQNKAHVTTIINMFTYGFLIDVKVGEFGHFMSANGSFMHPDLFKILV